MVEVTVTSQPQRYKQEIKAGHHILLSDAPKAVGGAEAGPDPHELLLGALGACTSMTVQMFAERRGWDLQEVSVRLCEDKAEDPEKPGQQISRLTRAVAVKGNLTEDQVQALKQAADKCLIHKLLLGPKTIETTVSPAKQ